MTDTNWLELWRELVRTNDEPKPEKLLKRYAAHTQKKKERPDPLLDFVLKNLDSQDTAIDIGAGSGRWTIPLAKTIKTVTAIDPTNAMADILRENLKDSNITNVEIVPATWEEASVAPHDITVCAHAMYSSADLENFVRKMEQNTRKYCYLAIRLPPADGILGELTLKITGCRHDSPDALIAYNALYSMGIYANVMVETGIVNWVNETLDEAFIRAKRHLHLENSDAYDKLIHVTLEKRLKYVEGSYIWPDGMRSALLWWSPITNNRPWGDHG